MTLDLALIVLLRQLLNPIRVVAVITATLIALRLAPRRFRLLAVLLADLAVAPILIGIAALLGISTTLEYTLVGLLANVIVSAVIGALSWGVDRLRR